ncbi:MAG: transcriptional repressor [Desulfarculaceae bacterium]|nr:transcriptional repressor [Desulfarculaceae bacterium]MCF8072554.1 transcriptional repressor [Desulfarculaceae bacterium]MCF8103457.1 transcriptional repressor [Desulfarculaceae bacterium]MCF8117525.1 transcriptional repressor [Desulfarculaceae bacterium]
MEQMIAALRAAGQRVTPQRLAVLRVLAESHDHPTVETIYERVSRDFPTTSLATIYKTLTMLKGLEQVLELGFAHMSSRYDGRKPSPHAHAICVRCGAIADPDIGPMESLAKDMAKRSGYKLTRHQIDFFGLCPQCQKKA